MIMDEVIPNIERSYKCRICFIRLPSRFQWLCVKGSEYTVCVVPRAKTWWYISQGRAYMKFIRIVQCIFSFYHGAFLFVMFEHIYMSIDYKPQMSSLSVCLNV